MAVVDSGGGGGSSRPKTQAPAPSLADRLRSMLKPGAPSLTPASAAAPQPSTSFRDALLPDFDQRDKGPTERFVPEVLLNPLMDLSFGSNPDQGIINQREISKRVQAQEDFDALIYKPPPSLIAESASAGEKVAEVDIAKRNLQRAKPMTWEQYEKLTPIQKDALDFNAMLVQAVRKDRRMERKGRYDDVPKQKQETYEKAVENIFGDELGSETFAPETLSVLREIDYQTEDVDFDEFLNLTAAIKAEDLESLYMPGDGRMTPSMVNPSPEQQRVTMVRTLSNATGALREEMAEADQLLASFKQSAAVGRNEDLGYFGGVPNTPKLPLGFGDTPLDRDFHAAIEALVNPANTGHEQEIMQGIQGNLKPEEFAAFLHFADIRSQQAVDAGVPLSAALTPDVEYKTPEEFREILGLTRRTS